MKFEGEEVDGGFDILIRQFRGDIVKPLALDEIVELKVTVKVSEISHQIDKKHATVTRTHVVYVMEVEV